MDRNRCHVVRQSCNPFVQLSELPEAQTFANQEEILDTWSAFMDFRGQAQKALEEALTLAEIDEKVNKGDFSFLQPIEFGIGDLPKVTSPS